MARLRRKVIIALLVVLVGMQVLLVRWLMQDDPTGATGNNTPPPPHRPTRAPAAHVQQGLDLFGTHLKKTVDELWQMHMGDREDVCSPKTDLAKSAITRARSSECKELLRRVGCLAEAHTLYPPTIPLERLPTCRDPSTPQIWLNVTPLRPPARIAFMFAVNGRSLRQVIRLLRAIYRPQHWYLFHVDARSEYLSRELEKFLQPFPNAWLTPWRLGSIWGAANLYDVYIRGIKDLLALEWDYFFNLSETDFPIQSVDELANHLRVFADAKMNLFRSHGSNHARFINKQGLDQTFVLCENRMWRVAARTLPTNLSMEGGSDWFLLHRSFAQFAVSNSPIVTGLRRYYDFSLLSAESFFHVVAANSPYCVTFYNDNFRIANWRRERGCHCQYKHLVDWCGCSPNVFILDDMHQLKSERKKNNFFARKFDPKISNSVITAVERRLLDIHEQDLPADSYWENLFDARDLADRPDVSILTYIHAFARIAKRPKRDPSACDLSAYSLADAHVYLHEDQFGGYTIAVASPDGNHQVEFLIGPARNLTEAATAARLVQFSVGSSWDEKERVFKRFGGLLTTADELIAAQLWLNGPEVTVQLVWQSPDGASHPPQAIKVPKDGAVSTTKFNGPKPVSAGLWRAALSTDPAVTLSFPVADTHPRPDEAPLLDQLISRFWSVQGECVSAPGPGGCGRAPICTDTVWSSRNPRGTVRAWLPGHIP
eukprot:m.95850 g.95850  ORF g.95850 m.95850 type:complete len:713 (-) comp13913_c1_seq2:29-2167(-)